MAGKHRRQDAHPQTPERRGPRPLEILDPLMTDESVVAHRHSGRYLALCGVQVFARQRSRFRPNIAEGGDPISDWPPVELPPTPIAPGGQPVPAEAFPVAVGSALSTREGFS